MSDDKKHGGARKGCGRKRRERTPAAVDKGLAAEVLTLPENADRLAMRPEVRAWHELVWDRDTNGKLTLKAFDARRYLTDKRDGKAVQNINHLHEKPVEVNAVLSLGEGMRRAMERAEARVLRIVAKP